MPTTFSTLLSRSSFHCWLEEGQKGQILNSKTGTPYDLNDSCVEKGPQVAYNAAAHQATVGAVKEFLAATFRLQ